MNIMKKQYQQPMTSSVEVHPHSILCASADIWKANGIFIGGGE
jgi:hypothetical protein